jgi:hypothetical protein
VEVSVGEVRWGERHADVEEVLVFGVDAGPTQTSEVAGVTAAGG